jgi:hypothetical protein
MAPLACDGSGWTQIIVRPGDPGDGGISADAGLSDATTQDGGEDLDAGDGAVSPIWLGVTPNPAGDGPPLAGDVIQARLKAIATGARATILRRTMGDLVGDTAKTDLAQDAAFFTERGVVIAFSLAVIDRAAVHLPGDVQGLPWDTPEVIASARASVDVTLGALGDAMRVFVLGRDVDVHLASKPEERVAFELFAADVLAYVRAHPLASPDVRAGVGFSFAGVSGQDPSFVSLLEVSDAAVVSYLPGVGDAEARPTSAIAADVNTLLARVLGKPIVLESAGYPSAPSVGGSDAKQALFLDTLFGALAPRRDAFVLVNIDGLHDLGPIRCGERASASGEPVDGPFAAFSCSLGLFTQEGQEKPAWQAFVNGAAAFASP